MADAEEIQRLRIIDLGGVPSDDFIYNLMLEPTLIFPVKENDG